MSLSPLFDYLLLEINSCWVPLDDKPEETPENTLRALWLSACGDPRAVEHCDECELPDLTPSSISRLRELLHRRMEGVPLAHLTGRQCFMGVEMLAGPEALIPRKETELLGYAALEIIQELVPRREEVTVIDLCTGCGNLALALAYHAPTCSVYGADLSEEAVMLARQNAQHVYMRSPVEFRIGDLFSPFDHEEFEGRVDVVVCNPPYISTQRCSELPGEISCYEPKLAFDGGPFGIAIIFRLIKEAPRYLKSKSWLCFEVGAGQGEAIARRLTQDRRYEHVKCLHDEEDQIRALLARTT